MVSACLETVNEACLEFDLNASIVSSLAGKQDYKKTKSVLKATRLKAEAKKNSTGFRVRLSWTPPSLLYLSACLSCLGPSAIPLVCLPANHLLSICLSVCLPIRERASQDHFSYPRLSAPLQLAVGPFGNATVSI